MKSIEEKQNPKNWKQNLLEENNLEMLKRKQLLNFVKIEFTDEKQK